MLVYVLTHTWSNEDNDGHEVLGVYSGEALPLARQKMKEEAERIRKLYDEEDFSEDYEENSKNRIQFGFDYPYTIGPATVYTWDIEPFTLITP